MCAQSSEVTPSPGRFNQPLAWLCAGLAVWTLFTLFAGGFTTSIQAGMAFLDWPLSHGSLNPEGWTRDQDMLAEHSHRLLAGVMLLFLLPIVYLAFTTGQSKAFQILAVCALGLYLLQALLGGLRVLLDELNTGWDGNTVAITFAIIHACLAQVYFCLLLTLVAFTGKKWLEASPADRVRRAELAGQKGFGPFLTVAAITCGLLFLQLLLGALMRHNGAGMALDGFPQSTSTGLWFPAVWNFPVGLNFLHRLGAVAVTINILILATIILTHPGLRQRIGWGAALLGGLTAWQFFLGVLTILTIKNPHAATFHMLFGAILLASAWWILLYGWKASWLARHQRATAPAQNAKSFSPEREPQVVGSLVGESPLRPS